MNANIALAEILLDMSLDVESDCHFNCWTPKYFHPLNHIVSYGLLTFSVSMWTTSLASGFSSHSGGPDGSFKNATMDWLLGEKWKKV